MSSHPHRCSHPLPVEKEWGIIRSDDAWAKGENVRALRERLILIGLALLVLSADQLTKQLVLTRLALGASWTPIPALERFFSISHVINRGAAFGLFPDQGSLFAVIAIVVVVAILAYYRYLPGDNWLVRLSLGLQLGGAVGNLVDRLRYGYVIDFIDFKIWPVFNLADVSIVTGVGMLAYFLMREPEPETDAPEAVESESSEASEVLHSEQ